MGAPEGPFPPQRPSPASGPACLSCRTPHPRQRLIDLLILWLCCIFVAASGLSLVVASGATLFGLNRLLIAIISLVAEHGL